MKRFFQTVMMVVVAVTVAACAGKSGSKAGGGAAAAPGLPDPNAPVKVETALAAYQDVPQDEVFSSTVQAYAIKSTTVGFGGPLTLMVGITPDGKVYNTSVLSHTETPGLGAKCTTDEHFFTQFKGFDPPERILSVKKDGGDVDAITASTITSRAYSLAVKNAVEAFKTIKGE